MEDSKFFHDSAAESEHRAFSRLQAHYVANYYVAPDHANRTDMSLLKNISLRGICFSTDKHFPSGTILSVSVRLPKIEQPVHFLAEVVYVHRDEHMRFSFTLGMKFVQIAEHDLLALEAVLRFEEGRHCAHG